MTHAKKDTVRSFPISSSNELQKVCSTERTRIPSKSRGSKVTYIFTWIQKTLNFHLTVLQHHSNTKHKDFLLLMPLQYYVITSFTSPIAMFSILFLYAVQFIRFKNLISEPSHFVGGKKRQDEFVDTHTRTCRNFA